MSFNRYINKDSLLEINDPQYGQLFDQADLDLIPYSRIQPSDPKIALRNYAEVHVYSFNGDYLGYDPDSKYIIHDTQTNSILVDVRKVFQLANINRGSFKLAINLLKPLLGSYNDLPILISEISPDRTELKLSVKNTHGTELQLFRDIIREYRDTGILNNVVLNFGNNRISKIVNIKFDISTYVFYVKLYKELDPNIEEKSTCWSAFETMDPYIDTVTLTAEVDKPISNTLKGPNFNFESDFDGSNSTIFKTWNELLDAELPTAQRLIDSVLSGSGQATLNIDYTDFNNFIFYSSAEERIKNFKYKFGLLETYEADITELRQSSSSLTLPVRSSITNIERRKDEITTNFDHFERWLYNHNTSSIFSHDISGSLTPWPKFISGSSYYRYPSAHAKSVTWYSASLASAINYDVQNYNRLHWSIPEHILMDEGNSEYITFVDMVGQHFDNLYSYTKALTQIHERDEHPERGPSNDLLYYIAKSFGWNLQNTRQLANLWTYKLGTDQSGSFASTGSMFSLSHENQTHQIWRRIVNNLPFLLKTKGTSRSVKAMMSIYGIPQTLLSIKEYGGPSPDTDKPNFIEDRFQYLLTMTGSQFIQLPRRPIPNSSGSWKGPIRVPDTVEFRFRTNYSASLSMSLWAIERGTSRTTINSNLELIHARALTGQWLYSGSYAYGKLKFHVNVPGYTASYSTFLPLYDNDIWTVRISTNSPATGSTPINVIVARASDNLYGRIAFSSSFTFTPNSNITSSWAGTPASPHYIMLGGTTSSNKRRFRGELQSYKEYFTTYSEPIFKQHVLNPAAYHTNNYTGSYYDLFRYYPLGVDVQRWNHNTAVNISSSHPNRNISFDTTASFKNFPNGQTLNYNQDVETYYITAPSIGGNVFRSDKIRLESSKLVHGLSTTTFGERSKYDTAAVDRNRLAIVFAPNDHVNLDILNHMGYADLDQYIADPDREFADSYPELDQIAQEYFQKYQQINNVNDLIRILSLYDYTFFDQIKQLAPGRADLITGILIEPHILKRSKVQLTKRPTITNPQWEKTINLPLSQSGEYPTYGTTISSSRQFTIGYQYYKTAVSCSIGVTASYFYKVGYITRSYNPTGDYPTYCTLISRSLVITGELRHHFQPDQVTTGLCDELDMVVIKFSGSRGETGSFFDRTPVPPNNFGYKRVKYHYTPVGTFATKYLKEWYSHVSQSYKMYSSRSLENVQYQIPEDSSQNNSRFLGSKLSGPGINIDSDNTVDGGPVVTIIESNPNNLKISGDSQNGNLLVE